MDADHEVRGEARVPDADQRRAAGRRGGDGRRAARGGRGGRRRDGASSTASASARPGDVDGETGTVDQRAQPARLGGHASRWPTSCPRRSARACALGNDVQVATDAEALLGAGRPYRSLLGVFWGTGVGGGIVLDGALAGPRGRGRDRPRGRQARRRALHRAGAAAAWRPTPGRGAMEAARPQRRSKGEKTELFEIMEERGRDRLTSGIWARALEREDKLAVELIDDAVAALGAGVASVHERARRRGASSSAAAWASASASPTSSASSRR